MGLRHPSDTCGGELSSEQVLQLNVSVGVNIISFSSLFIQDINTKTIGSFALSGALVLCQLWSVP
jgi:hypothetical protein